jgi:hypothetical protein
MAQLQLEQIGPKRYILLVPVALLRRALLDQVESPLFPLSAYCGGVFGCVQDGFNTGKYERGDLAPTGTGCARTEE